VFPFSVEEIVLLGRYPYMDSAVPSRRDYGFAVRALDAGEGMAPVVVPV
jgi:hypothetical protein